MEEALKRWLGEQVSRMEELNESPDQKRRELAMCAPVREKKRSAEECRRYGTQEEWKRVDQRTLTQQARRDQDKLAHKHGRGVGGNRISSPSRAPLRASTNLPAEPNAPDKLNKIIHSLTPSRVTVVDLVIPQGAGGTYTPNIHRVKPPGPIGAEAGKSRSRYEQEVL